MDYLMNTSTDISDQPVEDVTAPVFEFAATPVTLTPLQPEATPIDDVLSGAQDGLTIIFCSPEEFNTRSTLPGKHLDVITATDKAKSVALVCTETVAFPADIIAQIQAELPEPEDLVATYYGKEAVSEVFALRVDKNSKPCTFSILESALASSFFPFF